MVHFLNQYGSKRIALRHASNDYNPSGVLKLTWRQAARYPERSFGILTEPFRGIVERGTGAFQPRSFPVWYKASRSVRELADMVDGVVFVPRSGERNSVGLASDYLPGYCPRK